MSKETGKAHSRFGAWLLHGLIRGLVAALYRIGQLLRLLIRKKPPDPQRGVEVLLTGTFQSAAWIKTFLTPISMAQHCRSVVLVTTFDMPEPEGITLIRPPVWLRRIAGEVPSRLLTFVWQASRRRPEFTGGFHISINALVADLAAAFAGGRSIYVCVGGPIEIIDGGLWGESRFFGKLRHADPLVEEKLLRTVRQMDAIVTMGNKGLEWLRGHGVAEDRIHIITGGIDDALFSPGVGEREIDVMFVGRLVPIKRVDIFLRAIRVLADELPDVAVRIVGRGPLEDELRQLAGELSLQSQVEFTGFSDNVAAELRKAKCSVLTSDSEGLSLSMAEAMLSGAVPVVADVGDLGDLVIDGVTGRLVQSREPADFAKAIAAVLQDNDRRAGWAAEARMAALQCGLQPVAERWNKLFETTP